MLTDGTNVALQGKLGTCSKTDAAFIAGIDRHVTELDDTEINQDDTSLADKNLEENMNIITRLPSYVVSPLTSFDEHVRFQKPYLLANVKKKQSLKLCRCPTCDSQNRFCSRSTYPFSDVRDSSPHFLAFAQAPARAA